MADHFGLVVLAAGEGSRLKLPYPKPLAPLNGKRLVDFPIALSIAFLQKGQKSGGVTVVTGHERGPVEEHINRELPQQKIRFAFQAKRRGTADALRAYFCANQNARHFHYTIILCADTPLITLEVLEKTWEHLKSANYSAVLASFHTPNPFGYGRIVRAKKGLSVVEEKDATSQIKQVTEVNSGLYIVETAFLLKCLESIDNNNKAKEFYLTDIFQAGENVAACKFEHETIFLGVNTLEQLEQADRALKRRKIVSLREDGVHFIDSRHTWIEEEVTIGAGTTVHPNVHLRGKTQIARNCVLEPGCVITNCDIAEGVQIKAHSYLEGATLGPYCTVGPFARLRTNSVAAAKCKIGNFVETKNVIFGRGVSVSHLSYLGDAQIGEMTNIGCGFITCNYDGEKKHKTVIGKNSFIGSDSQAIAPVTIGDSCYVASGSTITADLPDGTFSVARSRQVNKPNMAKKFLKGKWKERMRS